MRRAFAVQLLSAYALWVVVLVLFTSTQRMHVEVDVATSPAAALERCAACEPSRVRGASAENAAATHVGRPTDSTTHGERGNDRAAEGTRRQAIAHPALRSAEKETNGGSSGGGDSLKRPWPIPRTNRESERTQGWLDMYVPPPEHLLYRVLWGSPFHGANAVMEASTHCMCGEYFFQLYAHFSQWSMLSTHTFRSGSVDVAPYSRILLQAHNVRNFTEDIWPSLQVPVSIIYHGFDPHMPGRAMHADAFERIVSSDRLVTMLVQNLWTPKVPPEALASGKVHALPIGLVKYFGAGGACQHAAIAKLWHEHNLFGTRNIWQALQHIKSEDHLILVDFRIRKFGQRKLVWNLLCGERSENENEEEEEEESGREQQTRDDANDVDAVVDDDDELLHTFVHGMARCHPFSANHAGGPTYPQAKLDYLMSLRAASKFVASPEGFGTDCFRTWEALLSGSFPVVKSSAIDPLFDGLPVLIVKKWTDLSPELLYRTYNHFMAVPEWPGFSKLFAAHWEDLLSKREDEHRQRSRGLMEPVRKLH